jgi:hypothetical protein
MAQRSSQRLREKQIVRPSSPKEEEVKFGSACKWGQEQLSLLNVDFDINKREDLIELLELEEPHWPAGHQARTFRLTSSVNM